MGARLVALLAALAPVLQDRYQASVESARLELETPRAKERADRVQAEIACLPDHPWAGRYICGDGLGRNVDISIAPDGGAVYTWEGCMGVYDFNHGDVAVENGVITVDWVRDPDASHPYRRQGCSTPYLSRRLVPVRWGDARLLLHERDVAGFCAKVNAGQAGGHCELNDFPSDVFPVPPCDGPARLPPAYAAFVLKRPVDATLVSLDGPFQDGDFYRQPAVIFRGRINAGRAQGVCKGLILSTFDAEALLGVVVRAEGRSVMVQMLARVYGGSRPAFRGYDAELGAWVKSTKVVETWSSLADGDGFRWVQAHASVILRPVREGEPEIELHAGRPLRVVGARQREVSVVAVDEHTAEIEIRGLEDDHRSWAPSVGWRVTSWGAGPAPDAPK